MDKKAGEGFIILTCPICQGTGVDGQESCRRCGGRGVFGWLEGAILTWQKRVDSLHIFEGEMERSVKVLINGLLVLFGVIGLAALVFSLINDSGDVLKPWLALQTRNGLMGIFAITLLTDLYAYYRMTRESMLERSVKTKTFESVLSDEEPAALFERAAALDRKKVIDIAPTYDVLAQRAVEQSWRLARQLKHQAVTPLHLMATLLSQQPIQVVLGRLGVNGQALVEKISRTFTRLPYRTAGEVGLSVDLKKVLLTAYAEAFYARFERVEVPQLLTAVVKVDEVTRDIFDDLEIEQSEIINVAEWLNIQHRLSEKWRKWRSQAAFKAKGPMNRAMTSQATPLLDRFSHDLTHLSRSGALAPCIGRDKEIEEIFRVLEGGKNVILTGFPGVGKTSIIEGIAELMTSEEVPEVLQDLRLVSLSVASLVGSAGRQGELEGMLMQLINEIVRSGNIILFIDNIQNMVGISTEGAENLDIADILANALQKRLFYCMATTTPMDYRRYVEPSGSLTSVFQKVNVEEPDTNGAIRILEGKSGVIEVKNQVYFSYQAIERTVKLAERYIHDRYLPEKAISILEEVAIYTRKKKGKNSVVVAEDVAEIVAGKTNVPITKIGEKETEKLLNLEQRIHERMVDQEEAVSAVATALRRARAELRDIRRPIVNLLFLGPTGVGKTELAKTVADVYFGSENNMIRLDMSEYQEKSSINRLIGAPPGYSGAAEGGFLTEAVRLKPFSLVLLDEIEKAHPDILNIFLQVMDDGRLTDTLGRTIDFTNTIIIATSNAGTQLIQDRIKQSVGLAQIKEELLNEELKPYFRPEFLNRFDNIVVFKPLSPDDILNIVDLMLKQVGKRLLLKGVHLEATPEAKAELARDGFDPVFGARPLRRLLQDRVDNALANYLLQGKLSRRDVAVLETGGNITVRQAQKI